MSIALALKYRPHTWEEVTEQGATLDILNQQLSSGEIRNGYLFCGPAGCGKTTCARIFANELNKGEGVPIELDAASNNSVEDAREIIKQAQTKSLDSKYKVFIIDECHSLSNQAWQAMLKLLEEPPELSVFIFCTTDPQKIPNTILSRVQRYDFQKISLKGIADRLTYILNKEQNEENEFYNIDREAVDYIAKLSEGGMRDAITLLDKCLAYSKELSISNVAEVLGCAGYDEMKALTIDVLSNNRNDVLERVEALYARGIDLKQFCKQYLAYVLDMNKKSLGLKAEYILTPDLYLPVYKIEVANKLLQFITNLSAEIKWDATPKTLIQARLLLFMNEVKV